MSEKPKTSDLKAIRPRFGKAVMSNIMKHGLKNLSNHIPIQPRKNLFFIGSYFENLISFDLLTKRETIDTLTTKQLKKLNMKALFTINNFFLNFPSTGLGDFQALIPNFVTYTKEKDKQEHLVSIDIIKKTVSIFRKANKVVLGTDLFTGLKGAQQTLENPRLTYYNMFYPVNMALLNDLRIQFVSWIFSEQFLKINLKDMEEKELKLMIVELKKLISANPKLDGLNGICLHLIIRCVNRLKILIFESVSWPKKSDFKNLNEVEGYYQDFKIEKLSQKDYPVRELGYLSMVLKKSQMDELYEEVIQNTADPELLLNILTPIPGKHVCLLDAILQRTEKKLPLTNYFTLLDALSENIKKFKTHKKELRKKRKELVDEEIKFRDFYRTQRKKIVSKHIMHMVEIMALKSYISNPVHHKELIELISPETMEDYIINNYSNSPSLTQLLITKLELEILGKKPLFIQKVFRALYIDSKRPDAPNYLADIFKKLKHKAAFVNQLIKRSTRKGRKLGGLVEPNQSKQSEIIQVFDSEYGTIRNYEVGYKIDSRLPTLFHLAENTEFLSECAKSCDNSKIKNRIVLLFYISKFLSYKKPKHFKKKLDYLLKIEQYVESHPYENGGNDPYNYALRRLITFYNNSVTKATFGSMMYFMDFNQMSDNKKVIIHRKTHKQIRKNLKDLKTFKKDPIKRFSWNDNQHSFSEVIDLGDGLKTFFTHKTHVNNNYRFIASMMANKDNFRSFLELTTAHQTIMAAPLTKEFICNESEYDKNVMLQIVINQLNNRRFGRAYKRLLGPKLQELKEELELKKLKGDAQKLYRVVGEKDDFSIGDKETKELLQYINKRNKGDHFLMFYKDHLIFRSTIFSGERQQADDDDNEEEEFEIKILARCIDKVRNKVQKEYAYVERNPRYNLWWWGVNTKDKLKVMAKALPELKKKHNLRGMTVVFESNWLQRHFTDILTNGKAHLKHLMLLNKYVEKNTPSVSNQAWNSQIFYDIHHHLAREDYNQIEVILEKSKDELNGKDLLQLLQYNIMDDKEDYAFAVASFYFQIFKNKCFYDIPKVRGIEKIHFMRKDIDNLLKNLKSKAIKEKFEEILENEKPSLYQPLFKEDLPENKCCNMIIDYALKLDSEKLSSPDYEKFNFLINKYLLLGFKHQHVSFISGIAGMTLTNIMTDFAKTVVPLVHSGEWHTDLRTPPDEIEGEEKELMIVETKCAKSLMKLLSEKSENNVLLLKMLGRYKFECSSQKNVVLFLKNHKSDQYKLKKKVFKCLKPHFREGTEIPGLNDSELEEASVLQDIYEKQEKPSEEKITYLCKLQSITARGFTDFSEKTPLEIANYSIQKMPTNISYRAICYYLSKLESAERKEQLGELFHQIVQLRREKLMMKVLHFLSKQLKEGSLDKLRESLIVPLTKKVEIGNGITLRVIDLIYCHMTTVFKIYSPLFEPIRGDGNVEDDELLHEPSVKPVSLLKGLYSPQDDYTKYKFYELGKSEFEKKVESAPMFGTPEWRYNQLLADDKDLITFAVEALDSNTYNAIKTNLGKLCAYLARYEDKEQFIALLTNMFLTLSYNEIYQIFKGEKKDSTSLSKVLNWMGEMLPECDWWTQAPNPILTHKVYLAVAILQKFTPQNSNLKKLDSKVKEVYSTLEFKSQRGILSQLSMLPAEFFEKTTLKSTLEEIFSKSLLADAKEHYFGGKYKLFSLSNMDLKALCEYLDMADLMDSPKILDEPTEIKKMICRKIFANKEKFYKFMSAYSFRDFIAPRKKTLIKVTVKNPELIWKKTFDDESWVNWTTSNPLSIESDRKNFFDSVTSIFQEAQSGFTAQSLRMAIRKGRGLFTDASGKDQCLKKVIVEANNDWFKKLESDKSYGQKLKENKTVVITLGKDKFDYTLHQRLTSVTGYTNIDLGMKGEGKTTQMKIKSKDNFLEAIRDPTKSILMRKDYLNTDIGEWVINSILTQLKFYKYIHKNDSAMRYVAARRRRRDNARKTKEELPKFDYTFDKKEKILVVSCGEAVYKARLGKAKEANVVLKCLQSVAQKVFIDSSATVNKQIYKLIDTFDIEYDQKIAKKVDVPELLQSFKDSSPSFKEITTELSEILKRLELKKSEISVKIGGLNPDLKRGKGDLFMMFRENKYMVSQKNSMLTAYGDAYKKMPSRDSFSKRDRSIEAFLSTKLIKDHFQTLLNEGITKNISDSQKHPFFKNLTKEGLKPQVKLILEKTLDYIPLYELKDLVKTITFSVWTQFEFLASFKEEKNPKEKKTRQRMNHSTPELIEKQLKKLLNMEIHLKFKKLKNDNMGVYTFKFSHKLEDLEKELRELPTAPMKH